MKNFEFHGETSPRFILPRAQRCEWQQQNKGNILYMMLWMHFSRRFQLQSTMAKIDALFSYFHRVSLSIVDWINETLYRSQPHHSTNYLTTLSYVKLFVFFCVHGSLCLVRWAPRNLAKLIVNENVEWKYENTSVKSIYMLSTFKWIYFSSPV